MSYNGSGTFNINSAGQPVVTGTVISSTVFNAFTADVGTGLSTAVCKDGQTTITANLPMSGFKFTGLGAGTAAGNSLRYEQVNGVVTTAGDLLYGSAAGTLSRLAAGTGGQILQMNSAATAPVWGGGVVQRAFTSYASNADLTTAIPADDTIPQNTEGTEIMTLAITPKSASNRIRIRFQAWGVMDAAQYGAAALFVDTTADALAAEAVGGAAGQAPFQMLIEYEVSAASTTARTYKIRVGPASGTMRLNGRTTTRFFGGVSLATLIVEEVA